MRIGILNIGSELLEGKVLNTNAFELSRLLQPLGHEIPFVWVVADDEEEILQALRLGVEHFDVEALVVTGGLGPTHDDRTKQALARFLGVDLEPSAEALRWLAAYLHRPASELSEGQLLQVRLPRGTRPLRNDTGTACGIEAESAGRRIFVFPGVPAELDAMARRHLPPALGAGSIVLEKKVWTFGLPESAQRDLLEGFAFPDGLQFSSLPMEKGTEIGLKLRCREADRARGEVLLEETWQRLMALLPESKVVDSDGLELGQAVQRLLLRRKATVAVAESCTSGALGFLLTEPPGSSAVFRGGFLTYSDQAKIDLLGVDPEVLKRHGAVSEQAVRAMVEGCLRRSGADYACAISGIAGPGGGTPEKPVGTVWLAAGSATGMQARRLRLRGDRNAVRRRSGYAALDLLRQVLQEAERPPSELGPVDQAR